MTSNELGTYLFGGACAWLLGFIAGHGAKKTKIVTQAFTKTETVYVARKPLTEDQLKECFEAKGQVCPRCLDDEELSEGEREERDDGSSVLEMSCEGCNETWRLVYVLARVEPGEG